MFTFKKILEPLLQDRDPIRGTDEELPRGCLFICIMYFIIMVMLVIAAIINEYLL